MMRFVYSLRSCLCTSYNIGNHLMLVECFDLRGASRTCKFWCGGSKFTGEKTFLKKKEFRHCEMLIYYLIMSEMNDRNSVCSQIINSCNGDTFKIQVFLLALYHSCSSNWRTKRRSEFPRRELGWQNFVNTTDFP